MSFQSIWFRLPPHCGVGRDSKWSIGLEAEVAHPLRLVLVLGDRLDDLAAEALGRLVGVALLGVVEAELLRVVGVQPLERALLVGELLGRGGGCGGCVGWLVHETSSLMVSSSISTGNVRTGWYAGSVLGRPDVRSKSDPWRGHSTVQADGVELALGERPVVVRAAVLDRVEGARAVEDADLGGALRWSRRRSASSRPPAARRRGRRRSSRWSLFSRLSVIYS